MRKLTDDETKVLTMIAAVGGSYCPDSFSNLHPSRTKLLRRLVNQGWLSTEETDIGPKFILTAQWYDA